MVVRFAVVTACGSASVMSFAGLSMPQPRTGHCPHLSCSIFDIGPKAARSLFTAYRCIYEKITEILCGVLKFVPRRVI
jgi:hypothetical protein